MEHIDSVWTKVLPDRLFFGACQKVDKLAGRVFLTPHPGIASLFIVDVEELKALAPGYRFNIGYRQWSDSNDSLREPLKSANLTHNIPVLRDQVHHGQANGFLYTVDIRRFRDRLSLFATNDPDREVIYCGEEPLDVVEITPHSMTWDFTFDQAEADRFGYAQKK